LSRHRASAGAVGSTQAVWKDQRAKSLCIAVFFAIALDEAFVTEGWQKAFDREGDFTICTSIGIEDAVIARLGALGRRELSEGGAGWHLYLEGLATLLTVHLLRGYSSSKPSPVPHCGGLTPRQMRRTCFTFKRIFDIIQSYVVVRQVLVDWEIAKASLSAP
jgi:hypothetical protein